ncbi:DUF3898 domain-containing protein [Peribacillus simplex]|uniref:DUF3898 domain-containing protein n=1 Tax=Peribacillus simplex TaxID=1478 RepID=A0AAW7IK18_9BACI|nr:DUF3898 domain-containing protein [Peribacillus simplex]MDM5453774.1 DUF3898 domain-containing protein [Peribacillus simplex]
MIHTKKGNLLSDYSRKTLATYSKGSDRREIQEHFEIQVVEATAQIVKHTSEAELRMKLGSTSVKGLLVDFGDSIHLGKINEKYY